MITNILIKDFLLLIRDKMGMALLLLMPIALVVVMTLLQDSTFKALENEKIELLVIDYDQDLLSEALLEALDSADVFNVKLYSKPDSIEALKAKALINDGTFKIGLIIPNKTTKLLRRNINNEIKKQVPSFAKRKSRNIEASEIEIFFDPIIKATFRQSVSSTLKEIIAHIQTQMIFRSYSKALERFTGKKNDSEYINTQIHVTEKAYGQLAEKKIPNSTQHNIPAWTVFAIFFIVIPLSGQIIGEKLQGTLYRLRTFPTPIYMHFASKLILYTIISILQVSFLLLIGKYLLPTMGLPEFDTSHWFKILSYTTFIGMAACSYAITIGIIAKSQHQAAIFGSISVVILAAIGGLWVPVYIMPESMQTISQISPLNWALEGYNKIILQDASWHQLLANILLLLGFSFIMLSIASLYFKRKTDLV
jgi:ABC-2 type transport system permease protein